MQTEEQRPVGEDTDRLDPIGEEEPAAAASAGAPDMVIEDEAELGGQDQCDFEEIDEDVAALLDEASSLLASGKADEASLRCRDAIALAPDLVAAYSLLGMAEEQRGNVVAAAGAYRRVLQLDPERSLEREKLELLHASGASAGPDWGREEEAEGNPVVRYAPWVAAVGAAFLVLMILTGVGWRSHLHRQAERSFAASMALGSSALDQGDYQSALQAFESAVAVRPEDSDAQQGLRYARRKLTTASRVSSATVLAEPIPHSATLLPSRGPNPFQPIPIGPTRSGDDEAAAPEPVQQQPARPAALRPPVVTPERVTGETTRRTQPAQTQTGAREQPRPEAVPFGPLEVVADPAAAASPDAAETAATPAADKPEAAQPPKRRGEISIWVSEAPPEPRTERATETAKAPVTVHADRARELRGSATRARQQGNCAQAAELYGQAIEAYRRDTEQNPSNRAANQAAIAACERAKALCKEEQ